jgi:cytochrome c oxidase assembly protein subunit 15
MRVPWKDAGELVNTGQLDDTTIIARNRAIATWLFFCCLMVFGMVVLGGVTRLTGSGLSMVEWNPIFGILPPLSQEEWLRVFELYRQSPEYLKINLGMDLAGFKQIYWFEYAHRVLGRSIGIVFLLPFLFYLFRGWVDRRLAPRLVGLFVLGGLQGLLGWYMVKSGLVDNPHVSQYRLTAHLGVALVIYGYMLHVALGLWYAAKPGVVTGQRMHRWGMITALMVFITMLSGGFVAGLKAGLAYNTFPLMGGQLVPEGILSMEPAWRNFFENVATVQFDHRVLAIATFLAITALFIASFRTSLSRQVRGGIHMLLFTAAVQVALGIATLTRRPGSRYRRRRACGQSMTSWDRCGHRP